MTDLLFRWVPGTTDRLTVSDGQERYELSLQRVKRVLGARSVDGLYLTGKASVRASEEDARTLRRL